jgi:hypothetical protein
MMAGWVLGKIFHSSWGLSSRFFCLKDWLKERKFTVSPTYSCRSKISATVWEHQLNGRPVPGPHFLPMPTAKQTELAQVESEIEKLLDTLTGATPVLISYANAKIEELVYALVHCSSVYIPTYK